MSLFCVQTVTVLEDLNLYTASQSKRWTSRPLFQIDFKMARNDLVLCGVYHSFRLLFYSWTWWLELYLLVLLAFIATMLLEERSCKLVGWELCEAHFVWGWRTAGVAYCHSLVVWLSLTVWLLLCALVHNTGLFREGSGHITICSGLGV